MTMTVLSGLNHILFIQHLIFMTWQFCILNRRCTCTLNVLSCFLQIHWQSNFVALKSFHEALTTSYSVSSIDDGTLFAKSMLITPSFSWKNKDNFCSVGGNAQDHKNFKTVLQPLKLALFLMSFSNSMTILKASYHKKVRGMIPVISHSFHISQLLQSNQSLLHSSYGEYSFHHLKKGYEVLS